jgi:putative ABC transport system permease protein
MALMAIKAKKGRSFLTMLGIIIGVGAVLILVTVVTGMNADMAAYYEKLGVNKVQVELTYFDRTNTVDISDEFMQFAANQISDQVIGVTPDVSTTQTLRYFSNINDTATVYFGNEQWAACNNYTLDQGRDLTKLDIDNRAKICVIGSYVAESLFAYAEPLGESISLNGSMYTVVGVYYAKDGTAESSMDDVIVVPYSNNRELLNTATVTNFTIKVQSSTAMADVIAVIEDWLAQEVNTNTMQYTVENGNDAMAEATDETTSLQLILAGVAAISLLVGGIGIMNIMLVTVTERTREIGIKKAIGARRQLIVKQFLIEAGLLSFLGGLVGIIIGYAGSIIIGKAMYDLVLFPSLSYVLAAALFSIIIGVSFGMYPAVKASGLQPVDALRAD